MKILKIIGTAVVVSVVIFFLFMFQPWVFLPHKHMTISLPFAASDDLTTSLIPMGEKIEHNKSNGNPDGHAGIDFGFEKVTKILSSSNGTIAGVRKNEEGTVDVTVNSGYYKITYKELNTVEKGISLFKKIKVGELIGYSGPEKLSTEKPKEGDPSRQIHWEFSSSSMLIDRLCPLEYFTQESKDRINEIWNRVPSNSRFKKEYPNICNGVFENKVD